MESGDQFLAEQAKTFHLSKTKKRRTYEQNILILDNIVNGESLGYKTGQWYASVIDFIAAMSAVETSGDSMARMRRNN